MRTDYCGLINENYIDQIITLRGWVHRRRDHGGVIFLDLRDREGMVQIVFNPNNREAFDLADQCRNEYVIQIRGKVEKRPYGLENPNLKSGRIEVVADSIEILNRAVTPAFMLDEENISESVRLQNRVLDLRRPLMQRNLKLRYKIAMLTREFLDSKDFIDIETPFLTRSTPEGARDYLVPSRVNPGEFFALPQSPQLFKQLLMVAGFDRYYQIVKCFRDEDLRADRQPEFTQIDIEASFIEEEEIMSITEGLVKFLFKRILDVTLPDFPRIDYKTAMHLYGSDRPDLRVDLQFVDITDLMRSEKFKVFSQITGRSRVVAMRIPRGGSLSRKDIDDYTDFVSTYGAKGLAYIKINDLSKLNEDVNQALQSPIVKFISRNGISEIIRMTGVENGDLIFFGAGKSKVVNESLGALRIKIALDHGKEHGYFKEGWKALWITDFPVFEYDEISNVYTSSHHPFTSPAKGHEDKLKSDPENCLARAYDMVLNGWEIGGGSIRIHDHVIQQKVFDALNISAEEQQSKFGFLLNNLKLGAPPHGGLAFGFDRLVTLMCGATSIRDVIAFPKTQKAQCLLTQAPSSVDNKQLKELKLKTLI